MRITSTSTKFKQLNKDLDSLCKNSMWKWAVVYTIQERLVVLLILIFQDKKFSSPKCFMCFLVMLFSAKIQ